MPRATWHYLPLLCVILVLVAVTSGYRTKPAYCSALYDPVCGSDGKTYWNECIFERHNCRRSWVTIAYNGRCKERRCPVYCVPLYKPVCGTDGQTYWNECEMRQKTCNRRGLAVSVSYKGSCVVASSNIDDCPDFCLMLYSPVCGNDGQTYFNECELKRHNCNKVLTRTPVSMAHKGRCIKKTRPNTRPDPLIDCNQLCMTIYLPVCGTDFKTYSNKCFLNMANCRPGKSVALAYDGPCQEEATRPTTRPSPIIDCNQLCMTVYLPVCGTDGKTYSNKCFLNLANCEPGVSVALARDGPCKGDTTTTTVKTTTDCDIVCTRNYSPVCGTDGKTYSNPCTLQESNCRLGTDVGIARDGECENTFIAGGLGATLAATTDIQSLVDKVRPEVEADSFKTFRQFTAATYRIQVVAGINYFVKVKVDRDDYLHVRIYEPLPGQGATELVRYQLNRSESDTIEYF